MSIKNITCTFLRCLTMFSTALLLIWLSDFYHPARNRVKPAEPLCPCGSGSDGPSAPHPLPPKKPILGGTEIFQVGLNPILVTFPGGERGPSPDKPLGGTKELELQASSRVRFTIQMSESSLRTTWRLAAKLVVKSVNSVSRQAPH